MTQTGKRKRATRSELKGKAQTVLGTIDPAKLGSTLMHEHVLWDLRKGEARVKNDLGPEITLKNHYAIWYGEQYSAS